MASSSLRTRARGGSQVAKRDPVQLKAQIREMQPQFQLAMPKGVEATQLVRDAMTVLSQNPKLAECDPRSVLGALMTCAQLGLRPGVLGQAYVIPFKGRGQLVIGYQGLVVLAQRSGDIASISARAIHSNDLWDVEYGLNERLMHKPQLSGDRGDPVAYYCVVKSTRGGTYWEFMTRRDVERHRDKFAMQRDYDTGEVKGPWVDHFDAMALKTVVKKALNLAPRNTDLVMGMAVDESIRVDVTPTANLTDVAEDVVDAEPDVPEGVEPVDVPDGVEADGQSHDPTLDPNWGKQ